MTQTTVLFQQLPHGQNIAMPVYATASSSGMDLHAAIDAPQILQPGERSLIPSGYAIAIPVGFEAQVRPRSGLAYKNGITVLNTPGTIDADYRGEVKVILFNASNDPFTIERGMRFAQLVIAPVAHAQAKLVTELPSSDRDAGGFGSTGLHAMKGK